LSNTADLGDLENLKNKIEEKCNRRGIEKKKKKT
jgi:hypothetical protein